MPKRIGICGGTFNPIHMGHLLIAEMAREEFSLEKILFIPAANPPHKDGRKILEAHRRFHMVHLAISPNLHFEISDVEMKREGLSYMLDTLREVRALYEGNAELYLITGTDTVNDLPNWHEPVKLLQECYIIETTRPDCKMEQEYLREKFGSLVEEKILKLRTPKLEISSTDIRRRIREGRSVRYMIPEMVEEYIRKEGLYL